MANEEPEETPEPENAPAIEITNLASVSIQLHELFTELKNSGFKSDEALTLAGMVLTSSPTVDFMYGQQIEPELPVGQIVLLDDDIDDDDDENFDGWDPFLENPDPQ